MTAIVFLIGTNSAGNALRSIGQALRPAFEARGHRFVEVFLGDADGMALMNRTMKETPIELAFSFAGLNADLSATTPEGKQVNLWEAMRVPYLALHGDAPTYFFDRHVVPGNYFASLYGFPEHCELRKRLPSVRGLLGVSPPMVLDPVPRREIDFAAKKSGRIVFLKNGNDPDALIDMWKRTLPPAMFAMLAEIAGALANSIASELGNDIDGVVTGYFRDKGIDVASQPRLRLLFDAQLDDYLRRLKSTLIVESLLDFPIEVHGYHWDHVDFSGRRAKLVPFADYGISKGLLAESLAVLDMSANTGLAPHDRPMRAFGRYTLCLTNEQEFFRRESPLHAQFSFRFERESIAGKVAEVLANPERSVELGAEVATSFRERLTTDRAVQFLLDVASCVRLDANSQRIEGMQDYFVWPPASLG